MKKPIVFIIALILCFCCSFSAAERKTVEKDRFYLGAMRIINCREYVSLRERPDKTSRVLAKVPLDAVVQNCNNNVDKYLPGKYKKQFKLFIRCEYDGIEGYILKKHLKAAPDAELAETRQDSKVMNREEIIGNGETVLDWKAFNVNVLAAYEVVPEKEENWETIRVGCFIDDEPVWGYTESVKQAGQFRSLKAFMGGTDDEPQVYVYDSQYGLVMLDLMDGLEMWTLTKDICPLGDAAVYAVNEDTGTMYIAGTDGPAPVAISSEGNVYWRAEISDPDVYGPTEIKLNEKDISVVYDSGKTVKLDYDGELLTISDIV
ncbi:MAG: hypothetical protein IKS46_00805 [Clostridia bacterium]|nr:hypothetical protein [Clostridia bacterium]